MAEYIPRFAITEQMVDNGAQAIRALERGHRNLTPWSQVSKASKDRWKRRAEIVLRAASETPF